MAEDVTELDRRAPPLGFTEPEGGAVTVARPRVEMLERPNGATGGPVESAIKWSAERSQIMAALVTAQGQFPPIPKNRTVVVEKKAGGSYEFEYATLDAVIGAIRKPLADNGLGFMQAVEGKTIATMLFHKSGEWCETRLPMKGNDFGAQDQGSAMSYAKRYCLMAMLGIAAEGEDEDGNSADGNKIVEKDGRKVGEPRKPVESYWGGPLTKTELTAKLRDFNRDLYSCEDETQFVALLESSKTILGQCERDLPSWWVAQKGADTAGLGDRIESVRAELRAKPR